jgi:hypothetical protein
MNAFDLSALRLGAGLLAFAALTAPAVAAPEPPLLAAEPPLVLAGRVDGVVPAGAGVATLRDGALVLLDADGRASGGCRGGAAALASGPRRDATALSREEVLGEAGFSPEDVSPEAEELLDDEGIEPRARRAPVNATAGAPRALSLAATNDAAWLGTVDGLWRFDARDGSCVPAALAGQEIALVAARGATVVALVDVTVWRSRDTGTTFDVAAVLTSPAHALALAGDETAFVSDEDGVVEIGPAHGFRRRLEGRVDALVACGPDVAALADDGVHRLDLGGGELLVGPRPAARALACASDGLVAAGIGLWTSPDGATWREEPCTLGRSFSGVAWAAGFAWLAGEDGLLRVRPGGAQEPLVVSTPEPRARPPVDGTHPPAWAGLLPRVAVAFDGWTASTGVAGWRLWVLLTVSLGRRWQRTTTENLEDVR